MKSLRLLLLFFGMLVVVNSNAWALLSIDITRGNVDPLPIALPEFASSDPKLQEIGSRMTQVIVADLERSGLFEALDQDMFIQKIRGSATVPHFPSWKALDANALVTGGLQAIAANELEVAFRLWDVYAESQMAGKAYTTSEENWRRVAHIVADQIYARVTGEKGYFDTRIVYVAESGPLNKRKKRLAIMDQDGHNHRYLTDGSSLVLTPRFDPNMQRVVYMSYAGNIPRVRIRNLQTGKDRAVAGFSGMSFAPRFSHDGESIVMSVAKDGNTEVYRYSIASGSHKRLTRDGGIDVSPSYAPDGKQIVFNSDRGGSQQLYVMDADGSDVRRISFGKGRYGTPAWSPRGDLIAFTKMHKGRFFIGVMRPDGSGERLLTESYLDEGPTWAPNGRVLVFARQGKSYGLLSGKTYLYSIDLTGYNEIRIPTPGEASDPAWSPLL